MSEWFLIEFRPQTLNPIAWLTSYHEVKMRVTDLILSYERSKLNLRVFLAGHIVAVVTYCATKLTATYSPMIVQFVDTMMLVSTSIEWLEWPIKLKSWKVPETVSSHLKILRGALLKCMGVPPWVPPPPIIVYFSGNQGNFNILMCPKGLANFN